MHDDINPPKRPNAEPASRQPMRSLRLRGYSPGSLRAKLSTETPGLKPDQPVDSTTPAPGAKTPPPKKRRFDWWRRLNRNLRFGIIALLLLLLGAGAVLFYNHSHPADKTTAAIIKHKPAAPKTLASPLTGVQVDPALAARPVTGIMIENSDDARPQSGLQDAGVVYEAIAEGGITRFLSLFQDATPQYVGPVRSLRPYYIDFAAPFQASIVHVGGSPDALSEVRGGNFRDLDQFFNADYFTRITARYAPHNVYTSFAELDKLNQSKGFTSSKFTTWPRKTDKKLVTPTAKTIDFAISSPDFYAHYDYDPATNTYARSEGGAPHLDLVSASDKAGAQLHPKVVIALVMSYNIASDGQHSVYGDSGTATAYVFQDGGVTQGTWTKAGTTDQISFADSAGKPIKLNAGQTWISLVRATTEVTYAP